MQDQRCRIELFGGLQLRQAGRVIRQFRAQKLGALLAYLAYFDENAHQRERLIEMHWPDLSAKAARNNLSVTLTSLRGILEPPGIPAGSVLWADRENVRLNPEAVITDVREFRTSLQAAGRLGETAGTPSLERAVALYRGPLLQGYFEDWMDPEQRFLSEQFLLALGRLCDFWENTGNTRLALEYAGRAVGEDPLCEDASLRLMRLFGVTGQPGLGLRHYSEYTRRLAEELQQAPSRRVSALAEQLRRQETGAEPGSPSPARYVGSPGDPYPAIETRRLAPPSPSGDWETVTILLCDLGAVARNPADEAPVSSSPDRYRELLKTEALRHGGQRVGDERSGCWLGIFRRASAGIGCALACRQAWEAFAGRAPDEILHAPMVLHSGEVQVEAGAYHGETLTHAVRLLAAAQPGQILCSEAAAGLIRPGLPEGARLRECELFSSSPVLEPTRLYRIEHGAAHRPQEPVPSLSQCPPNQMPLEFNRFFGREMELDHLTERLSPRARPSAGSDWSAEGSSPKARLMTLTGPGGSGKTRLALQVGHRLVDSYAGAAWYVPLADCPDALMMIEIVRTALGLPQVPGTDPLEQVLSLLERRPSLLILDNLEHLLPGAARGVGEWLERLPSLVCLCTSRQRLGLTGEVELAVTPLPVPLSNGVPWAREELARCESVQLFVDRAQAVRQDFQLTSSNAAAVAGLCIRLEGIPLALELAAARVSSLTPAQILCQLDRRLDFLVARRRGSTERHRTLRGALDWSFRMLPPDHQRFFARLSVFRGGWNSEAAAAISPEMTEPSEEGQRPEAARSRARELLAHLQACSLIQVEETPLGTRFRMLETLREYGLEQLREANDEAGTGERHARYYHEFARNMAPLLHGARQTEALQRLDLDFENLRAALDFCRSESGTHRELGLALAWSLAHYWYVRGYWSEARSRLADLLALPGEEARPEVIDALNAAGHFAYSQGDLQEAEALLTRAHSGAESLALRCRLARSLNYLGKTAQDQSRPERAREYYEKSLQLYRELGDELGAAQVLSDLGFTASGRQAPAQVRACLAEALTLFERHGEALGAAAVMLTLSGVANQEGRHEERLQLLQRALDIFRDHGDLRGVARALSALGEAWTDAEPERAAAALEESLRTWRSVGHRFGLARALERQGLLLERLGRPQEAQARYTESLGLYEFLEAEAHATRLRERLRGARGPGASVIRHSDMQRSAGSESTPPR